MKYFTLISVLTLGACASVTPAPVDFHVNVAEDIASVEAEIKAAREEEVALLAPREIDRAATHVRRAAERRRRTERRDAILSELGLAHAYLNQARARADRLAPALKDVFAARRAARAVGAERAEETARAFAKLDGMIRKSYPATESARDRLSRAYRTLEVTGVESRELGVARDLLLEARRQGAKLVAPDSLRAAEAAYFAAARAIDENLSAPDAFRDQVSTAENMARALTAITAQAHVVAGRSDEDVARELLIQRQRLAQLDGELRGVELNVRVKERRLRDAVAQNEFNGLLERARQGLGRADAEVFQTGDRLLIRLKSDKSATLRSVKGVIKDLKAHDVIVQGGSNAQAAEVARSLAEVGPVARTVDPNSTAFMPVEVVLTPATPKP